MIIPTEPISTAKFFSHGIADFLQKHCDSDFCAWLRVQRKNHRWLSFVITLLVVLSIPKFFRLLVSWLGLPIGLAEMAPPLANVLLICIFFYISTDEPPQYSGPEYNEAQRPLSSIIKAWRFSLLLWLLLYLVLLGESIHRLSEKPLPDFAWISWAVGANFLINAHSAVFLYMYHLLSNPFPAIKRPTTQKNLSYLLFFLWFIVSLVQILTLAVYKYSNMKYSDTGVLSLPFYRSHVQICFDLTSGVIGGIALVFFISRAGSKIMGRSPSLIGMLYLYAVLQPLYAFFHLEPSLAVPNAPTFTVPWLYDLVLIAVAPLKVLLFLYVYWLYMEGKMLFYFCKGTEFLALIPASWEKFNALRLSYIQKPPVTTGIP